MKPRVLVCGVVVALAVVGAVAFVGAFTFSPASRIPALIAQPSPMRDPALRLPGMAEFIKTYPQDWETRVDPSLRPKLFFQRAIGEHGTVVSFADNLATASNPSPRVRVFIMDWDGADLFAQGAPATYNGKPVEFVPVQGQTQPATN